MKKCVVSLAALALMYGHGKCLAAFLVNTGFGDSVSVSGTIFWNPSDWFYSLLGHPVFAGWLSLLGMDASLARHTLRPFAHVAVAWLTGSLPQLTLCWLPDKAAGIGVPKAFRSAW